MPLPPYFEPWIAKLRAVIDSTDTKDAGNLADDVRDWAGQIQNNAGTSHGLAAAQAGIENARFAIEELISVQAESDEDEEQAGNVEQQRALALEELDKLVELLKDIPPSERAPT